MPTPEEKKGYEFDGWYLDVCFRVEPDKAYAQENGADATRIVSGGVGRDAGVYYFRSLSQHPEYNIDLSPLLKIRAS